MISKEIVNKPITTIIVFSLLILLGIYASFDLAIDLYPEINPPILLIFTDYEGAGPEDVEKNVTRVLEGVLSNVSNVDKISSTSAEGSSQIMLEFTWGVDMSEAANDVRDKLEFVRQYMPEGAETPMIFKFDPSMIPIMNLVVSGNRSPEELREIAENIITPRIEQVEGVSLASISGGREKVIRVEISQNRLEAHNLTLTQVSNMLRAQNVQISAGSIDEGNKSYLIRTSGEYEDIEEIRNTVIAYKGGISMVPGRPSTDQVLVRLRDIAEVYDGLKDETSAVYYNGNPGVYISIQKQSGTNSVKTADNVKKRLERIRNEVPYGVNIEIVQESTTLIRNSLKSVISSVISGALLAILILFVFLRSFKGVIIIGVSIPISVLITLMFMYFFNLTLNLMTLSGLALGIGMLVDNSIVILENIYHYREKGAKHTVAAIVGSQEMIKAITASTLTTICVFAPVVLFKNQLGFAGVLFSDLAFTVVISLTASLLVAIFLVPVLTSYVLPLSTRMEDPLKGPAKIIDDFLGNFINGMSNGYKMLLLWFLRHKAITLITVFIIFISSFFLVALVGFELMPQGKEDSVTVNVELAVGTTLEETKLMLEQFENLIKQEITGYKDIIVNAGEKGFMGFLGSSVTYKGSITITLPEYEDRTMDSDQIKAVLREHFNDYPAVFSFGRRRFGGGSASPIDIVIKTDNLQRGREIAETIRDLIKNKVPKATEPTIDMQIGLPQVEIIIDRDKAYALGLNVYSIGNEIRANMDGVTATKFRRDGNEYDVLVILDENDRQGIPDLSRISVVNQAGMRIPVSSFAHIERSTSSIDIKRENQTRVIHVTAGYKGGERLDQVELEIRKIIRENIPNEEGVIIDFSGDFAELQSYFIKLFFIFAIAVILVFGVMASQFESLIDPLIIFFTIPLTFIGVIWIYIAVGTPMTIYTIVGIIVLAGVVVNNGIVLVDYANLLKARGNDIITAISEAGRTRLRPVLMTTLTTILGLIPMAFFEGEGTDLSQPIALTILGGLTVSTLFTLFVIPILYFSFSNFSDKLKEKSMKRRLIRIENRKLFLAKLSEEHNAEKN